MNVRSILLSEPSQNYWPCVVGGALYFGISAWMDWMPTKDAVHAFYWECAGIVFCWLRNKGW